MKFFLNKKKLNEGNETFTFPPIEDIERGTGTTTLYRVAFKEQVESLFKYGYNRAFTGTKGGNTYGPGVYCTFKFEDTVHNLRTKPEYGNLIVQMRLIGGFNGFIIFDENLAKQTYGNKWRIKDQFINVAGFDEKMARDMEQQCAMQDNSLYHGRTAGAARYLWCHFSDDLFKKHGVKGIIYKGNRDGHCALPYNFSAVIPYAVSYDGGKTFKKKFNAQMYEFLKKSPDVDFIFGGNYKEIFLPVNGFVIVGNNNKYNIINVENKKQISKIWFDDIKGQINPSNGEFIFTCDGIRFYGTTDSPEPGVMGCIIDPFEHEPFCPFSDLDKLIDAIKSNGFKTFEELVEFEDQQQEQEQDEQINETRHIVRNLIENIVRDVLYEEHLKVVDNISEIVDLIGQQWTSPDDVWWIKIEARLKDYMNYNRRNDGKRNFRKKWWSRVNGADGTRRENHVGYVIVRGATKEACQDSIKNAVVHLNPWAAREFGTKTVFSNGNAEALKTVCHNFFARSYITINKRSMTDTINVARRDKNTGLFRGREFHHRVGQTRTGIDSSGVNWEVKRPLGLIDCDIDDVQAQAELDKYLKQNGVTPLLRKPSHDGMHYVISIKDAQGLDFTFLDKYATNNRPGDPNVLFKPDANLIVYSAVG